MYRLQVDAKHVLLFTITILASLEASTATANCKTVVMDKLMKECKFGSKIKRNVERIEAEKLLYKFAQPETSDVPGPTDLDSRSVHARHKRQSLSGNSGDSILPGGIVDAKEIDRSPARFYRSPSLISGSKLSGSEDVLGFDLSTEDFEELYNEIAERLPRNLKSNEWKIFKHAVAKCCQNIKVCMEAQSDIPCILLLTE